MCRVKFAWRAKSRTGCAAMKCEEFDAMGWELERGGTESVERAAALEHVNGCARCAALQESWEELRAGLGALRTATWNAEAPPRVEMRLRQEFRATHRSVKTRATFVFAGWAIAAAALLIVVASWWNSRMPQHPNAAQTVVSSAPNSASVSKPTETDVAPKVADEPILMADSDAGGFTLLPGSLPQETEAAAIVRVRMQRGALGALGLPVNEERAADWLQVDLLLGEDGQPRAVRLPNEVNR